MKPYQYGPNDKMLCQYCQQEGRSGQWILILKKEEHERLVHHIGVDPEPHPREIVQFYSEHAKMLLKPQQLKVLTFLEKECIVYEGGGVYICKPIPDYNKTTYRITKDELNNLTCTCQYNKTTGQVCSHIGALYEFWARQAIKNK